ncbi:MAG: DUF3806 domain-containing protein [Bacteroidota bacterium]
MALRRFGSPTHRSALRRLDDFLENKRVLERRMDGDRLVATVEPIPEQVEPLSEAAARSILENAALISQFMIQFGTTESERWSIRELNVAYAAWVASIERKGYTDEIVVEILGAAFGQRCVEQFGMRWVKITDEDGTALAIQGIEKDYRAFPYDAISKRIADGEHGFFLPIFASIRDASEQDWRPTGGG